MHLDLHGAVKLVKTQTIINNFILYSLINTVVYTTQYMHIYVFLTNRKPGFEHLSFREGVGGWGIIKSLKTKQSLVLYLQILNFGNIGYCNSIEYSGSCIYSKIPQTKHHRNTSWGNLKLYCAMQQILRKLWDAVTHK